MTSPSPLTLIAEDDSRMTVTSLAQAAERFGIGSMQWRMARGHFEGKWYLDPTPRGPIRYATSDGHWIDVTSLDHAAELWGYGSGMWSLAFRHFESQPRRAMPTPEEWAEAERVHADAPRAATFSALFTAFGSLHAAQCLVEAYARASHEADVSGAFTFSEWRDHHFRAVAILFNRSPEMLPFGRGAEDEYE